MAFQVVERFRGGVADLGQWGSLHLTGADAAVIKARQAPDIALPEVLAAELTHAALMLDDARGALLIRPFAGESIARVTLTMSDEQCSITCIPRHDDPGMLGGLRSPRRGRCPVHDRALLDAVRRAYAGVVADR